MAVLYGHEERSFAEAVESALSPGALEVARRKPNEETGYVAWGEYGRILDGYASSFPREQMLILFTEDLERSPADLLRRLYAFIGVAPDVLPDNLNMRYLVGATKPRIAALGKNGRLSPWALQRAAARNGMVRRIWHSAPASRRYQIELAFRRVTYPLEIWNRRPTADALPADAAERLRTHFADDGARLARAWGVSPPWLVGRPVDA